jgi:hypothetical protein
VTQASRLRGWIRKAIKIVVIVEVVYVLLLNSLLFLPLTQTLINEIRPEKFRISWQRAWTLYPFHVNVRGVFANGQSRSQQWQFETPAASGSIALLPLVLKQVRVRSATTRDIEFRLRPRFKEGRDYTPFLPFYPDIEGWEMTDAVNTPRKKKRPWNITVNNIEVSGAHSVWIHQFRGTAEAAIAANLTYRSRGGPFSLDAHRVNLRLDRFFVNDDQEVLRRGSIRGSLGFAPFRPREHKDVTMLNFLRLDAAVDIDLNNLGFINVFLLNFREMSMGGSGKVTGHLRLADGAVQEGTGLLVDADNLGVRAASHTIQGDGEVRLDMGPETGGAMNLAFAFEDLEVIHADDSQPMLTGRGLELTIGGDGRLVPDPRNLNPSRTIDLRLDGMTVPDLAVLQRYLPQKWPFRLHGGDGTLGGKAALTADSLAVDLQVTSEDADMGIREYRFDTDLDLALKLDNPDIMTANTCIAGSYIRLTDARLRKEGQLSPDAWEASFIIRDGDFTLFEKAAKQDGDHLVDLFTVLGRSEARQVLGNSSAAFEFESSVSSLAWIAVLLKGNYQTRVAGRGELSGTVKLVAGLPEPGTDVQVLSDDLAINFLDFWSSGDGTIDLSVTEGGVRPDWHVAIELSDARMRRQSDAVDSIQDVNLELNAHIEDVSLAETGNDFTLTLEIPSAVIADMSVFNSVLPPDHPLQFAGGSADLTADIVLQREDADGWVKLRSSGVEVVVDQQSLSGDLDVDVLLVGGVPADMIFDISGSELRLSNVRVSGESAQFDEEAWSAQLTLTQGETTWKAPVRLDVRAELGMSDSRPIVAMFDNQEGWRPGFLSNMLTTDDIAGDAQLHLRDERVVIPHAQVTSDSIDVAAKVAITAQVDQGVLYARYKKLDALIRITDGKKRLELTKALQKYQEYQLDH